MTVLHMYKNGENSRRNMRQPFFWGGQAEMNGQADSRRKSKPISRQTSERISKQITRRTANEQVDRQQMDKRTMRANK